VARFGVDDLAGGEAVETLVVFASQNPRSRSADDFQAAEA
jgi:hypothetical protein